jgi:serine phosphatase RsbU (regulator of sigma subunit)
MKASKVRYHFERLSNLPLGILDPIEYEQFALDFEPGDVVLLYTDAITESEDSAGNLLGETGLLSIMESLESPKAADAGEHLLASVDSRRGSRPPADDQTLVLMRRTDSPGPRPSVLETATAMAKMLGLGRV